MIRQPIISVLGHVDAGKTTLLDHIRGTLRAGREAGGITQMIGCTSVPLDKIEEICGSLLDGVETELEIPGLLFIDTPGHAAFASLRKRGGALSDIAVVVVDVTDGLQPQTLEAIELLQESETPFVVALNKIDTIAGWEQQDDCFMASYQQQGERVRERLDDAIYDLMAEFADAGFTVDRYDRVDDFTAKVGVVPLSAETGEGVPDLLMVLSGLAQRYMAGDLDVGEGVGEGTVLEVNAVKGFGTTIDVILYDGMLREDDTLVVGGRDGPVTTSIKALLEPRPLQEIRDEDAFDPIDAVSAAAGVKVAAPELDRVVAGAPVRAVPAGGDVAAAEEAVTAELEAFEMDTADEGIVVKADSLGSLEAVMDALAEADIPVRAAAVGKVNKRDVVEAGNQEPEHRSILAFNTAATDAARKALEGEDVQYIESDIIYELVEAYQEREESLAEAQREQVLANMTRPAKIRLLPDHVFRSSGPAVVGVEIVDGVLNSGSRLLTGDGDAVGRVKSIQDEGDSMDSASKGQEVAVSITSVTVGRQIEAGDVLYTNLSGQDYKIIKRMEDAFTAGELQVLETIVDIKDSQDPRWKLG